MLTIRAMVEFGPWVLDHVEVLNRLDREDCSRCSRRIRYVYVLRLLHTGEVRRVGSTCGPLVVEVSEEVWGRRTERQRRLVALGKRLEKLLPPLGEREDLNPEPGHEDSLRGAAWVHAQLKAVAAGSLKSNEISVMNTRCKFLERKLKAD